MYKDGGDNANRSFATFVHGGLHKSLWQRRETPVYHTVKASLPVVIFEAYFDESGHPNDPAQRVFSIAGFVAPSHLWKRWELDWLFILNNAGIRPEEFHMKDYAHSIRAFSGWQGQEGQRRRFLSDLLHTFNPLFVPIGSSVVLEDYRNLADRHKAIVGSEYELCLKHVLLECASEAANCPEGDQVSVVLEEQEEFSGSANKAWEDFRKSNGDIAERIHSVQWQPKKSSVIPLLGADLLAYELREFVEDWHYKEPSQRRNRYPMSWILQWLQSAGGTFNKQSLKRLADRLDLLVP